MIDFEIIFPNREDVEVITGIPSHLKVPALTGFEPSMLKGDFGHMLFEGIKGDHFEFYKNSYDIQKDLLVKGLVHEPILECTIMYENSFHIDWQDVTTLKMPNRLIQMYYAPASESLVRFPAGKVFTTIDFHIEAPLLQPYAMEFPILARFLEKVERKEVAQLFYTPQFTTPGMEYTIRTLLSYRFKDELAPRYYENLVHVFIIQLLEAISNFTNARRSISAQDIERATEAKRLLTLSYDKSYKIKDLCKMLHTNPYNLKSAFRHLHGTSIGRYKKQVLMEQAKLLLLETNKTIDEISIILGYSSQQSFTAAFRAYYKSAPVYWRRIQRR